jgi:uncharacterized protein YndB with AHSA1/START domain
MKILKRILLVIGFVISAILIIGLFVKKDYQVERDVVINKPRQEVFDYVKHLKNQDNFSKWASMDPEMRTSYHGTDGNVGFVSAWESDDKNVGKGEQEITGIIEGHRIDYELRFIEPFESTSLAYMITEDVSDQQTKVRWGFTGRMKYPMNLMLLFMDFEKMIGDDFEHGLENLKAILE